MNNNRFSNRGPRRMPGMAAMLAASLDLGGLKTQEGGAKIDTHLDLTPPAPDAAARGLAVFVKLAKAEQRVANVEKVIGAFAEQAAKLPADDLLRATVERMLQTFRDCLTAVPK